jgi:hypothetical protein
MVNDYCWAVDQFDSSACTTAIRYDEHEYTTAGTIAAKIHSASAIGSIPFWSVGYNLKYFWHTGPIGNEHPPKNEQYQLARHYGNPGIQQCGYWHFGNYRFTRNDGYHRNENKKEEVGQLFQR